MLFTLLESCLENVRKEDVISRCELFVSLEPRFTDMPSTLDVDADVFKVVTVSIPS